MELLEVIFEAAAEFLAASDSPKGCLAMIVIGGIIIGIATLCYYIF